MKPKILFLFFLFFVVATNISKLYAEILKISNLSRVVDYTGQKVISFYPKDSFHYTNLSVAEKGIPVTVPFIWEHLGYKDLQKAWFRILVFIPKDAVSFPFFAVSLGQIVQADEIYLNGHLVGHTGEVDGKRGNYTKQRIYVLPERLLHFGQTNVIALRVRGGFVDSGFYRGSLKFGPYRNLFSVGFIRDLIEIIFVVFYLLVGFAYLFHWFFFRGEKHFLAFAASSILFGIYRFVRIPLLSDNASLFYFFKTIEFGVVFLFLPLFAVFLSYYFDRKEKKVLSYYFYLSVMFSLISLLLPSLEMRLSFFFWVQWTWLLPFALIFKILGSEVKQKNRSALLMLGMIGVIFVCTVLDSLSARGIVVSDLDLSAFAIAIFAIFLSVMLNIDIQRLYKNTRELNAHLEDKIALRTRELNQALNQLKEYNFTLEQLALLDSLTGLYNRRFFDEQYEAETERVNRGEGSLSLLMMDIDDFKKINDIYGHSAGDQALVDLAEILKQMFRRTNDCVCRYGGDEVMVLLPDTPLEHAVTLGERVRRKVEESQTICQDKRISFTVSVGVAGVESLSSKKEVSFLLKRADEALYKAKEKGRNRVAVS